MATWHPTHVESWITELHMMEETDKELYSKQMVSWSQFELRTRTHTNMTTKCYYVSRLALFSNRH